MNERLVRTAVWLVMACVLVAGPAQARDRGADGHFEKRVSSHFVLYQDVDIDRTSGLRGSRNFERQVLDTLEGAYDRLDAQLGLRPERKLDVVVHDPALFDRQFAGLFRFPAAGFYSGTIHIRGGTVVDQRLVRTLYHELVHAAFDALAPSLVLPAWFNEGVAEWFEARSLGKRSLSGRQFEVLTSVAAEGSLIPLASLSGRSFGSYGAQGAWLAYLQSYAFIDYLGHQHGERALARFCENLLRKRNLDRAATSTYRKNLAELERGFVDYYMLSAGG